MEGSRARVVVLLLALAAVGAFLIHARRAPRTPAYAGDGFAKLAQAYLVNRVPVAHVTDFHRSEWEPNPAGGRSAAMKVNYALTRGAEHTVHLLLIEKAERAEGEFQVNVHWKMECAKDIERLCAASKDDRAALFQCLAGKPAEVSPPCGLALDGKVPGQ